MKSFNFKNKSSLSRLEINNKILEVINRQLGSNLELTTELKELELKSYKSVTNWAYDNGILDKIDLQILDSFNENLGNLSLSKAINALESDVKKSNLNSFKTEKFQYLANVVRILENERPGFFTSNSNFQQKSCWSASLGLALATVGLASACNPPALGATVGTACYAAGLNFIRASVQLAIECKD